MGVKKLDEETVEITQPYPFRIGKVDLFLWATFELDSKTLKVKKTKFEFYGSNHHTIVKLPYNKKNFDTLFNWALKDAMDQLIVADPNNLKGAGNAN